MIIAKHITHEPTYQAILRDGCLKPLSDVHDDGEGGWGFGTDYLTGDVDYVFLTTGGKYQQIAPDADDRYYFAFDARHLITRYDALVCPDLGNQYDELLDAVITETCIELAKREPMPDAERHHFGQQMGITSTAVPDAIRQDSKHYYPYLLQEINDLERDTVTAIHMRDIFIQGVIALQRRHRCYGVPALELVEAVNDSDRYNLEILVPSPLPVAEAIRHGKLKPTFAQRITTTLRRIKGATR